MEKTFLVFLTLLSFELCDASPTFNPLSPFAQQQNPNQFWPYVFEPLMPASTPETVFTNTAIRGPFVLPKNSFAKYFMLSFSLLTAPRSYFSSPEDQTVPWIEPQSCRHDAMFMSDPTDPSGMFWFESLQSPTTLSINISSIFADLLLSGKCMIYNGQNILPAIIGNSTSDFYFNYVMIFNLPIGLYQRDFTGFTNRTTISFAMNTSQSLSWSPTEVCWNNIPNIWWKSSANVNTDQEWISKNHFNASAARPSGSMVTKWCGDVGYLILPQPVVAGQNVQVLVIELSYTIVSGNPQWTAVPILSTENATIDYFSLEQVQANFLTFCYFPSSQTTPSLFLVNPDSTSIWKLDSFKGWVNVQHLFRTQTTYGAPRIIEQPVTQPPMLCWQSGCNMLSYHSHTSSFVVSTSQTYPFNAENYIYAWSPPELLNSICMIFPYGGLFTVYNFRSTSSANQTLGRAFPRMSYIDGLSQTLVDGTSAYLWGNAGLLPAQYRQIVGFDNQIFAYVCDAVTECKTVSSNPELSSGTIISFNIELQTMSIMTIIGSIQPPLGDYEFHGTMRVSGSLLQSLLKLPPTTDETLLSQECLIYSGSIVALYQLSLILTGQATLYLFCPTLRQFFSIGNINLHKFPNFPGGASVVYIQFEGGYEQNQILCLLTTTDLSNTDYSYVQLLLGTVETNQIIWTLSQPSTWQHVYAPPTTCFAQSYIFSVYEKSATVFITSAIFQVPSTLFEPVALNQTVTYYSEVCYNTTNSLSAVTGATTKILCSLNMFNYTMTTADTVDVVPLSNGIAIIAVLQNRIQDYPQIVVVLNVFTGEIQQITLDSTDEFIWGNGKYVPESNKLIVLDDPPQKEFTRKTFSITLQCPAGYFNSNPNLPAPAAILCTECPIGTWSNNIGATVCVTCVYPLTTVTAGSSNSLQCNICPSSFCHEHGQCVLIGRSADCQCNFGYSTLDRCAIPWLFVGLLIVVTVIVVVTVSMRQYRKFKEQQRLKQVEMNTEINTLKQAWQIEWTSLTDLKILAAGGFGAVYSGTWCDRTVAVKVMHDAETSVLNPDFEREARALRQYRNPHIVLFYGIGCNPDEQQFIVTEFVDRGSLRNVLEDEDIKSQLTWTVRLSMAVDTAAGVEFLHRQNPPVIHRDLKSPNVLVTSSFRCKIGDLGTARLIEITQTSHAKKRSKWLSRSRSNTVLSLHEVDSYKVELLENDIMSKRVGTTKWAAPEMLKGETNYGLPVDIYALGIVFWEIMTDKLPFEDVLWSWEVVEEVSRGKRPEWPEDHFGKASEAYTALAEACWRDKPDMRPIAEDVLQTISLIA